MYRRDLRTSGTLKMPVTRSKLLSRHCCADTRHHALLPTRASRSPRSRRPAHAEAERLQRSWEGRAHDQCVTSDSRHHIARTAHTLRRARLTIGTHSHLRLRAEAWSQHRHRHRCSSASPGGNDWEPTLSSATSTLTLSSTSIGASEDWTARVRRLGEC